jgi:hypothetical protein
MSNPKMELERALQLQMVSDELVKKGWAEQGDSYVLFGREFHDCVLTQEGMRRLMGCVGPEDRGPAE